MGEGGEEKLGVDTIIFHYMHIIKFSKNNKKKMQNMYCSCH